MKRNEIKDIDKIFFQNYENLFNVYEDSDGLFFYNINRTVNLPDKISAFYKEEYVTEHGDTWTNLAYRFYNDVKLWWIICLTNGIMNPCEFPKPGTILSILNNDVVKTILNTIRDS